MAESVKALPAEIQELIDTLYWNVKNPEGIARKKELGAPVIPAIAIEGEVVFLSFIPPQEELIEAIRKRL